LASRVALLADIRSEEGYVARIERNGPDFLLIEDHCPICAAASAHRNSSNFKRSCRD
jgi:predicted ArsR family transcriptional regulator